MNSRLYTILLLLLPLAILTGQPLQAKRLAGTPDGARALADSIMEKVIFFAPFYEHIVDDYHATLYVKGQVHVRKQNRLVRYIPSMFRLRKGVDDYIMENYSELHYTAPNIYDQKVTAGIGTSSRFWEMDGHLLEYFHINIYASTLLFDRLLSPLAPNARSYYTYRVDSIGGTGHDRQFKISFTPKSKSYQLVSGYMVVSENVWSVREIRFKGYSELLRFNNLLQMGEVGTPEEFLPLLTRMQATFRFLGNVIDGTYTSMLHYGAITQKTPTEVDLHGFKARTGRSRYDLSDSYTLSTDTNAFRSDTAYFSTIRPEPLAPHEQQIYDDYFLEADTLKAAAPHRHRQVFWGQIGDALVSRYTVDLSTIGSVRCSPLINPFLLSYSHSNGFSYRQEFKYNRLFTGDRLLRVVPKIGYNFNRNEFYWAINSDYDYLPTKRASLHISVGNGNRIYSSEILDELHAMPDSIFDFNRIHLDYFKDLYLQVRHSWEMVNGLTLDVGFSIHRRREAKYSDFTVITPDEADTPAADSPSSGVTYDTEYLKRFRHNYINFAPRVRLTWTPGQYYYMNGQRKVNLYSRYPTMSVDWERGISGVFHSTGRYERVEADVQYALSLGLMRNIYFRGGWGKFTNQKELYFVDFANLARSNLPVGWNDDIGGVFQLLDRRWYNSSTQYVRANLTYEAPFLLLTHLRKYTQYILNERLYLNMLRMPRLHPYTELGYGIGTNVFDFGLFVSFANWKYDEVGVKFTFELFDK